MNKSIKAKCVDPLANRIGCGLFLNWCAALLFVLGCLNPNALWADDTDVFLGSGNVSEGVQPNVLLMLDNSGSMLSQVYDERGRSTGETRLATMKSAVDQILRDISGVNIGLMRFNGPGGSILYPVTNIHDQLTASFITDSDARTGADDAVELLNTGDVTIDGSTLQLGQVPNPNASTSITSFLQDEDDDAEQSFSGFMLTTGQAQFNMQSNQINGLRYHSLGIPVGATIVEAKLEFTAPYSSDSHVEVLFQGQDAKNPPAFGSLVNDVSDRLTTATAASVGWELTGGDPWIVGGKYLSPDIGPILQELVDRPDWDPNDAVVFVVSHVDGTGSRAGTLRRESAASTQGLNGSGTLLHVTYSTNEDQYVDQLVGLRFPEVDVPKGATITSARLDFTSALTNLTNPDTLELAVSAENIGDAAAFEATNGNLSDRLKFSTTVDWHPDDVWDLEYTVQGPDVTSLVQQVVNHASWCGGNALALYLQPKDDDDTQSRLAYAAEASLNRFPNLDIRYTYDPETAASGTGCNNQELEFQVNSSENDARENRRRRVDNNNDVIEVESRNKNGFRFEDVTIEQGAEILEAYLIFKAYPYGFSGFSGSESDNTGSLTMKLWAHDTDHSAAFPQSRRNISNRSATSAMVNWSLTDWSGYDTYQSPDIKTLIQEVVNRSGWSSGNALSILQQASGGGTRGIYAYDASLADAVKLVVKISSGGVSFESNSVRDYVRGLVQSMDAHTWTPIVDSLYEAALYYRGQPMYYGKTRELMSQIDGYTDRRYKRVSVAESYAGGSHTYPTGCSANNLDSTSCRSEEVTGTPTYISPINSDCQTSHIVVLTDGAANNNHSESIIKTMIGDSTCSNDASRSGEKCGRSLASWLANTDHAPAFSQTDNVIYTHTIAFNLSGSNEVQFLKDLASQGLGSYHTANTASELTNAFDEIIRSIVSIDATLVSPGATVNQFNRLTHRQEVYFSLFKPTSTPAWPGNLKRYKLLGSPAVLSDAQDIGAIDESTGFFKPTAKSVWSSTVDGDNVEQGGAASKLDTDPDNRKIYTYITSSGAPSLALTSLSNKFHESNTAISAEDVGATTSAERTETIKWARGVDLKDYDEDEDLDETRLEYGDPLHSVPQIITYGGTNEDPDTSIFFGTNAGFLHAIDGRTGEEIFSFIPEDLFSNLNKLYNNSSAYDHPYGLDGSPEVWVNDVDGDAQIESGDHVYLYVGMRRGGRNLYALDITDRDAPRMLWTIKGGTGDFSELGQTWSKPAYAQVEIGSTIKDVIIFGGGYDTNQDSALVKTIDTMGRAIYMVDAETGERLWWASASASSTNGLRLSDMKYAIPSDVAVVDTDLDGQTDQFYVGDMGGQLWRFDVHQGQTGGNLVTGGMIADIADTDQAGARRFFKEPDVSAFATRTGGMKLAVSLGSGTVSNPLNRVMEDRFYVFYQDKVFGAPDTYTKIEESDLANRTGSLSTAAVTGAGWYTTFSNDGEKVLAASLTVNNHLIFTTYQPDNSASACTAVVGTGRVYVVNLLTGRPSADLNEDGVIDEEDFSVQLRSASIPPPPKMLFPEGSEPVILIGPEQPLQNVTFGVANSWQRSYWYESGN